MEGEQAQDSVGSVLEEGGYIEGKAHLESSTGPEIIVEPNTRRDVANDVLVNDEPTVEQQDQMTPVLVGVASPPQSNQSATEE